MMANRRLRMVKQATKVTANGKQMATANDFRVMFTQTMLKIQRHIEQGLEKYCKSI